MIEIKSYLITLFLLLFSSVTYAGDNIANQEINYIATGWTAEGIYVETVIDNVSSEGCGPRFRMDPNHPMKGEMVSLLLSAFHTGTKVNLYVNGCATANVMILESVGILK